MRLLDPTAENIMLAATALRAGKLVGMPTETVYGIAAVATNQEAIWKVFELKGRPADNPLIVHVASRDQVAEVASTFPADAQKLADAFWPGPLTLVLPKTSAVPDSVTAGLQTVAVRMPAHVTALALIETTGAPLAAPSANRFMSLSPTRPEHISDDIAAGLAHILDGGPCEVGIESTVVDCTDGLRVLRPGGIAREMISHAVGARVRMQEVQGKSPGQYRRHYAPRTPVVLVKRLCSEDAGLTFDYSSVSSQQIAMPRTPVAYAAKLYSALAHLDGLLLERICVEEPPRNTDWEAVWDRLRKAASPQ
ncbi:MAG: L-threonylcarbamoyladenylate synthase [Fimbriimonas sp.]